MPKKAKKSEGTKAQQTTMTGEAFKRPNRIPELDKAAEDYRKARDKRMAATKVETDKKAVLKNVVQEHGLKASYFYDDEDGDTEEIKPVYPGTDIEDVKVNKVKQAKTKADE